MDNTMQSCFTQMTYGIYVLTCCNLDSNNEKLINGMIASWVSQISYEPPLIMAAVHPNRFSHQLLQDNPVFGLHILKKTQKDLLKRFKGPYPQKKFEGLSWSPGKTGVPILNDCVGWFELEIREKLTPGNHTLFISRVVNSGFNTPDVPLSTLDYDGAYLGKS